MFWATLYILIIIIIIFVYLWRDRTHAITKWRIKTSCKLILILHLCVLYTWVQVRIDERVWRWRERRDWWRHVCTTLSRWRHVSCVRQAFRRHVADCLGVAQHDVIARHHGNVRRRLSQVPLSWTTNRLRRSMQVRHLASIFVPQLRDLLLSVH